MNETLNRVLSFFDLQGLAFGVLLASLSLVLLKGAGLVTGQTAGLALLLSYITPIGFGALFFGISVPFFLMGWSKRGGIFAFRTFLAISGISVLTPYMAELMVFERIDPLLASILGGACGGMGVIAMFRHNASAGGMTILSLVLEQRTGLKAGWVQLGVDFCIFMAASFVLGLEQIAYSLLGAVVMNLMIAWNFNISQSGMGKPSGDKPSGA